MKRTLKRELKVLEIAWVEGIPGDMSNVDQIGDLEGGER